MNHYRSNMDICPLSGKSQDEFVETSLIKLEKHSDLLLGDVTNLFQKLFHQLHRLYDQVLSHHSSPYNLNTSHEVHKINEHALDQEVEHKDIKQEDNDNAFDKLDEFVCEYNENRPSNRQINGDAVIRCFRENDMDYTNFKDLHPNLKRYGIPAGAVRKLWRFLNPVQMNENDQDDENVVIIPAGSYIYIPSEYQRILFENPDIDESIDFEIGQNLSVPDDWSDGD